MKFWLRSPLREEAGDGTEGGGGAPAFDPAKFRAEILAEFNKGLNGALKNLKNDLLKKPDPEVTKTDSDTDTDDDPKGQKTDPKVKSLEKKLSSVLEALESEKKARIETETKAKTEKLNSTLRTELLKHIPAERIESAMRIFGPDVRYAEDGSIVGGADEQALTEFITAEIQKHEYLLPPKSVGGAGATPGMRRGPAVQLEDIKPGMKPDDLARVRAEVARVAQESGR